MSVVYGTAGGAYQSIMRMPSQSEEIRVVTLVTLP